MSAAVGTSGSINQCVATPENPYVSIFDATLSSKGTSLPLFREDQQFSSSFYRVRCDKIAARSKVEIVLAIIRQDKLSWAAGRAGYNAVNRARSSSYGQCFSAPCDDMGSAFHQ
jgi:hypothetical protein